MEFGLYKYGKIVFKKGKLVHLQNLVLDFNREVRTFVQEFEQGKTYKYLGTEENEVMRLQQTERKIEERIHEEIKNGTEIRVECQE